jgi:hypothetical protein
MLCVKQVLFFLSANEVLGSIPSRGKSSCLNDNGLLATSSVMFPILHQTESFTDINVLSS